MINSNLSITRFINFDTISVSRILLENRLQSFLSMIDFVIYFIILDHIILPHGFDISVKDHDFGDHIEKLYYPCRYQPICIYCGEYLDDADEDASTYPQCLDCEEPEISKR